MKTVEIEYKEIIERINTVTIEVEDNMDEAYIMNSLDAEFGSFNHPDDVFGTVSEYGKIIATCTGAEDCIYELN